MRPFAVHTMLLRFRICPAHELLKLRSQRRVAFHAPLTQLNEMRLEPLDRIAEGPVLPLVAWSIARRVVAGRMGRGPIGVKLDEGRTEVGASAICRPARCRVDGKEVVTVDPDAGHAIADRS